MTTQEKIASIIKDQYSDYKGTFNKPFKSLHENIRIAEGDEKFLKFLEDAQKQNPRPTYKPLNNKP